MTVVSVDGNKVPPSGNNLVFNTTVGLGDHEIVVVSPGSRKVFRTVTTSSRETVMVEVVLEPLEAEQAAQDAYEYPDTTIINPRYYGDKSWVVFFVASEDGSPEGSIVIARYDRISGDWKTIDEGTDFNLSLTKYDDAPDDLLKYVGTL